jgi:hypothetical protein
MAIPQGATAGVGLVNLVNVKFGPQGATAYQQFFRNTDYDNDCVLVARYVDLPGGFSTFVGVTVLGVVTIAQAYLDSVFCDSGRFTFRVGLTLLQSDYGSSRANYGTSQYPTGYAPVPTASQTGRLLRVGPTRTYTTVIAAYNAAQHGDDIVIDAGTYDCNAFHGAAGGTVLKKCVRFWGATEDPDDVVLTNDGTCDYGCGFFQWYPNHMGNVPEAIRAPGFFHVTITRAYEDTYESTHSMFGDFAVDQNPYNPPPPTPTVPAAIMFSCNT